eukprot:CAMPEP_0115386444 /NCGR_PEP_ID=MMETSP0271-20121206/8144_1 /TAXON_ID=71861 /ORGANISM="Scrippsiella trochoidea, Strain CCMP3099" /LENGTH=33 /DNA_ID= /DNA_START= /DNA_END= /DNA_ORIENTATION=
MPALFTQHVTGPKVCSALSNIRDTCATSDTSAC